MGNISARKLYHPILPPGRIRFRACKQPKCRVRPSLSLGVVHLITEQQGAHADPRDQRTWFPQKILPYLHVMVPEQNFSLAPRNNLNLLQPQAIFAKVD